MLEIRLIDDTLNNLFYNVSEGFESSIFVTEYDYLTKFFKHYISDKMLSRKEHILVALYFSRICDNYNTIPEIYHLIYKKDGTFAGYTMAPVPGEKLDAFCDTLSLEDKLVVFKNIETTIKVLHNNEFCLTDFNPKNFLISNEYLVKLVDIDSFCIMDDPKKNMLFNYKYTCPYTKLITKQYNMYCFYSLFVDMIFKVNRRYNSRKEILRKITSDNLLPQSIKEKLIYFANIRRKKQLINLDYLF